MGDTFPIQSGGIRVNRLPTEEEIASMSPERRWYWTHLEEARRIGREKSKQQCKQNPESRKQIGKRSRGKVRRAVFSVLGGAECVNCGCDDFELLEVNHKNGGGAKEMREKYHGAGGTGFYYDILKGRRSKEDLNVLCRVCQGLEWAERKSPISKGRFEVIWREL